MINIQGCRRQANLLQPLNVIIKDEEMFVTAMTRISSKIGKESHDRIRVILCLKLEDDTWANKYSKGITFGFTKRLHTQKAST